MTAKKGFIGTRQPLQPPENQDDTTEVTHTNRDRATILTVVETVYYQPYSEEARGYDSRYQRRLESKDEEPYQRRCKAGPEWQRIDIGWLAKSGKIGLLLIENREGTFRHINPTDEERQKAESLVLEVGILIGFDTNEAGKCVKVIEPIDRIQPRESRRSQPIRPDKLYIRCVNGEAKYLVTTIPN